MKLLTKLWILPAFALLLLGLPTPSLAAAGVFGSGGGTHTTGKNFTVTITASGDTFDSLQGTISVSGPVSVVSFSAGSATWLPGKTPANNSQFVGITSATSSLRVATITLKGTSPGSGSVSVSGVKLARNGAVVGSAGSSTSFTIQKALAPAGAVSVSSPTHPDQSKSYEATTADFTWNQAAGVSGFSYLLDQNADTAPPQKITDSATRASYKDLKVGTHYFHIRAINADGWGPTTTFKVTIKEPDPQINTSLTKPQILSMEKAENFTTDLDNGTATGLVITGKSEPGYKVNLTVNPAVPEGTTLSTDTNDQGEWKITWDKPVRSGFYSITAQGQKDKTLTPVSDAYKVEISIARGGSISSITTRDAVFGAPTVTPEEMKGGTEQAKTEGSTLTGPITAGVIALLLLAAGIWFFYRKRHANQILRR